MAERRLDPLAHRVDQPFAVAGVFGQVIGFAEGEGREARAPGQRRQAEHLLLLVEVQVEHADAVAEGMRARTEAPVADPAVVERAVHSASPNAAATRRALTTPSSWKPLAQ